MEARWNLTVLQRQHSLDEAANSGRFAGVMIVVNSSDPPSTAALPASVPAKVILTGPGAKPLPLTLIE